MFCSLYRADLLLAKNNILCVNNRKKGDSKYAELLLKNISQKKSICYTKYFPTVFMLIFDIYSDLQNKDKEIAETFYKKTNELLNKNLYPEFDLNGNLINNIIINPEIITFDEFINKYCSIENRCIDNNNDSVSNEIIDHLQFLYNFLTSPQLVHSIWDESFFDPESDDGINSKLIFLQDFLSIDNNDIFTLDLVEYLYKCYEKYTDIQDFYYIDDDPTILAKIFLFSAAYLRLHPDDDKKSIPFRKCNICKHNYISIDISSKDNDHCYCFICRSNYNELINGYNTLFNNSIAPARSRMSFNNEKIKTKWSDIYEIIEKSKYYEIKKYLKDKILRLDKKVFSDEIKTELKFLEFPDEIGNHSLENLQYFYKNYLCKSPFEKLFDEASEKERNDFVYNAKLILNKNIKQDFFDLDKNT